MPWDLCDFVGYLEALKRVILHGSIHENIMQNVKELGKPWINC